MNRLYFGDNLHVLRDHLAPESVDLIYLDPPFNSKRDYNLLFKTPPKIGRVAGRPGSPLPAAAGADASKSSDGRQRRDCLKSFQEEANRGLNVVSPGSGRHLRQRPSR